MAIRRCVNASTRKSPNSPVTRVSIFAVFLLFRPLHVLGKRPSRGYFNFFVGIDTEVCTVSLMAIIIIIIRRQLGKDGQRCQRM
jgi:hypothetical protein